MPHRLFWYVLSGIGALVMTAAGVSPGDAATNLSGWAEALGLTSAADWIAQNVSDTLVIAVAAAIVGFSVARWWPTKQKTEAIQQSTEDSSVEDIANAWWTISDIDPANTFIILSAGIESSRLQGNHPALEIFFTAYNGGVGEVRLVSAGGSFRIGGQEYPKPAELKSATSAKHGEIALFTVRQWIDQQDVPRDQQGQNHVVLQLSGLKIEAIAIDPVSGNECLFVVPLPDHLQFDVRHHWNIQPEYFSRFYRERLGTDDKNYEQTVSLGQAQSVSTRPRDADLELITLPEAVSIAFDRIRDAAGNKDTMSFQVAMRIEGNDQHKIPYYVCQTVFNGTNIPLFGIYPPSKQVREIPREHAESFMFSDDASEMFNQYNRSERYHSVAVRRSDLEQRLREIT